MGGWGAVTRFLERIERIGTDGFSPMSHVAIYYGSVGGSVIIKPNTTHPTHQYIVLVRCGHPGYGEDYNAVYIP